MSRAQTIQIFLPSGDAKSLRQAEITTRTVRLFEIPRRELDRFKDLPEAQQPALYFLFGEDESGSDACYIGQSDLIRDRLAEHNAKKGFWSRALVAVSQTNTWTAAHVQYMEHKAIQQARAAGRYTFDNFQRGHKTPVTPALEADCEELFETIEVLLATLGYPLFDKPRGEGQTPAEERFHLGRGGVSAVGAWTAEGMTVFAGSTARPAGQDKVHTKRQWEVQQRLIHEGVLVPEEGLLRFVRDHVFATPSGASAAVVGSSSDGWSEWVNSSGRTLREVQQATDEEAEG